MAGRQIDSLASSVNGSLLTSAMSTGAIGLFTGQIAYLGVQFTRAGQPHYGYLHLDVSFVGANAGNLLDFWDTWPGPVLLLERCRNLQRGHFLQWWALRCLPDPGSDFASDSSNGVRGSNFARTPAFDHQENGENQAVLIT